MSTRRRWPGGEAVGGGVEDDAEFIDLAGLQELLAIKAVAVAGAEDAVGEVELVAAGGVGAVGIDVQELGGEVGVDGAAGGVEHDFDEAGDLEWFLEGVGLEAEDVGAAGQGEGVVVAVETTGLAALVEAA